MSQNSFLTRKFGLKLPNTLEKHYINENKKRNINSVLK